MTAALFERMVIRAGDEALFKVQGPPEGFDNIIDGLALGGGEDLEEVRRLGR